MARKREKIKPTIIGRLTISRPEDRAWLLLLMRKFREAIEMAHHLLRKGLKESEVKRRITKYLSNAWYSTSAIKRAKLYLNQPYLKLRKPQLFSVGSRDEKGNRNIKLVSTSEVLIKIPHATGEHSWLKARVKFGEKHIPIIRELATGNYSYGASIVLKEKNKEFPFYLHLHVPLELYIKYMRKESEAKIMGHIAGFDFNPDRICMVIIDQNGIIRDVRNEHFPEVTSHGFSRDKARTVRREAVAKLVKYAREHGVKYYVIEDLSKPKPKGTRTAKRKISRMALREFIQQMEVLVPKVDGVLIKVNPAYSSVSARIIAEDLGLDIHTASAYIIALRSIKRYATTQKVIT